MSRRVLVLHGDIYGFGGAENHAIKIIRILQNLGLDVTVLHAGGLLDAQRIFRQVGVQLDPQRVQFVQAPIFQRFPRLFAGLVLLRYAFVLRAARRLLGQADFVVGTYGETPLSTPRLVQTMHIPLFFFDRESLHYLGVRAPGPLKHAIRIAYVLASRVIAGWSRAAVERGVMLANSRWTAGQFQRHYPRGQVRVIYHGASTEVDSASAWYRRHEERDNTMVIVGRVVPFKRVEMAITIVDRLRARGHALELLIIGGADGPYAAQIEPLVAARPHVSWRRSLSRVDMERLISTKRWGLHCAEFEHYGLAPLELQRLGCVTFVHDSGGQVEVVRNELLKYDDTEDAVAKIDRVLSDAALARRLFDALPGTVAGHEVSSHREAFIECLRQTGMLDDRR